MNEAKSATNKLRYKAYFWLLNVCLVGVVIGLVDQVIDNKFGYSVTNMGAPWFFLVAVPLWLFSFAVPLFLMVAKFMRDEYAELLWRRTLVILAYIVGITPIVLYVAAWLAYWLLDQGEAGIFSFLYSKMDFAIYMQRSWMWFMALFVGIFQFLRWKDSR